MSHRPNDGFLSALDEARRQAQAPDDDRRRPRGGARVRAQLEFGPAPVSGGEARFGLALEWTDEPSDRAGRQAPASTEEAALDPAEIAVELGLSGPLTQDQLVSRWRDFLWRNHPDRQPAHARRGANDRVAIANTLYDRARREFVKRR